MGSVISFFDGMKNALTGLGGAADKGAANRHYFEELADHAIATAYSDSAMARQVVEVPADDATKKWRDWSGDGAGEVEALEADLNVQEKIREALISGRLWGGGAVLIGLRNADYAEPLNPEAVKAGDLEFITALDRYDISPQRIVDDPTSALFGKPASYTIRTGQGLVTVHPSRLVLFTGARRAGRAYRGVGWGLSALQSCLDEIRHYEAALASVSGLLAESKIDVIYIPGLTMQITDPDFEQALIAKLALMQQTVGNQRKVVLDAEEKWETHRHGFEGVEGILDRFAQAISAAADIPQTRLFGRSPAGMNATGDSDLTNYYDAVTALQKNTVAPAMRVFDEVLVRSALGNRPDNLDYEWSPIKEMTQAELAEISSKNAQVVATLAGTRVYADEEVAAVGADLMAKSGVAGLGEVEARQDEGDLT